MNKDMEIPNQPMCKNPNCTELADMRQSVIWEGYCSWGCLHEADTIANSTVTDALPSRWHSLINGDSTTTIEVEDRSVCDNEIKLEEENEDLRKALKEIVNIRNTVMSESMYVDACIERARKALEEK